MLKTSVLKGHETLLAAISGGGDSLALLYLLAGFHPRARLFVATVDHGLRPAARGEAEAVARHCARLGLHHTILSVDRKPRSAGAARNARHALLGAHARNVGATAILLGHTRDDQAETVLMRALRMQKHSNTRGLAGMAPVTARDGITLLRPLLDVGRASLRDYLQRNGVDWIDDPSNADPASERVRTRYALSATGAFPPVQSLASLATLCTRSRAWLEERSDRFADNHLLRTVAGETIEGVATIPRPILLELTARSIRAIGKRRHLPANSKLADIMTAAGRGETARRNVGGCLLRLKDNRLLISPEKPRRRTAAAAGDAGPERFVQRHGRPHESVAL